ncbi:hypothetical protein BGAFAR04_E0029 (plasmid) [Borreliella garinii Far04]|nr:hypothetical protein BGAFAR04_E0029 [Borreliella garinii Far04]
MYKSQLNDNINNIIDIYKIITLLITNFLSFILKIKNN